MEQIIAIATTQSVSCLEFNVIKTKLKTHLNIIYQA